MNHLKARPFSVTFFEETTVPIDQAIQIRSAFGQPNLAVVAKGMTTNDAAAYDPKEEARRLYKWLKTYFPATMLNHLQRAMNDDPERES